MATPVSHIDCAPTILEATGAPPRVGGRALPGASLFAVAQGATPARPVISEYHAIGSVAGAFMLRFGQWKYCHYVAYPPQLFDLEADPEELADLAGDARFADIARRGRAAAARGARSGSGRRARQAAAEASCSRDSAAARRRSRAATWASRRRRAPPPRSTSPALTVCACGANALRMPPSLPDSAATAACPDADRHLWRSRACAGTCGGEVRGLRWIARSVC